MRITITTGTPMRTIRNRERPDANSDTPWDLRRARPSPAATKTSLCDSAFISTLLERFQRLDWNDLIVETKDFSVLPGQLIDQLCLVLLHVHDRLSLDKLI